MNFYFCKVQYHIRLQTHDNSLQQEAQRHDHGPWPDTMLKQMDDEINSCQTSFGLLVLSHLGHCHLTT